MKAMESDGKYAQQPAYNESFAPPAPPSYSEAMGASNKPLHPVRPASPPGQMNVPPMLQPVPVQPFVVTIPAASNSIPVAVGPKSCFVMCSACNLRVKTKTKSVSTKSAHIACFLLCLFGCGLCSCIPYCMNSFSVIQHYCPNCNNFIGMYKH